MVLTLLSVFLPSIYMGWALGANDAANLFGPSVATGAVKFRNACIFITIFVLLGSILKGQKPIKTVGYFTDLDMKLALLAIIAAASVVTLMTYLGIPVSTSQAVLGGVMGVAIFVYGFEAFPWTDFVRVVASWVVTPLGAMGISIGLYYPIVALIRKIRAFRTFGLLLRIGLIAVGSYGAYSLGANNVANTTGVFVGAGLLTPFMGTLLGGLAIALGACTYSRKVMQTVGDGIVPLDPISAFIIILSEAITLNIFTQIGVPVSASQAAVGGVLGIGMIKGVKTVNKKLLFHISIGWISTPLLAIALVAFLLLLF